MFVCNKTSLCEKHEKRTPFHLGLVAVVLAISLSFAGLFPTYAEVMAISAGLTPSDVSAQSAVLMELESGQVLYQKDADRRLPMASTTKIMTALVALERMPLETVIRVSPLAVGVEGSSVYLYEGEVLTLEELLYAMLLESANDAAAAIAIAVGGSIEGFANLMNQKASDLGLTDTHFTNPHGLDHEDHYTTAKELALIAAEVLRHPELTTITSTRQKNISHGGNEGIRLLINHNKLLRSCDGCIGMKTGFTKKSGRCLVSAAERDGMTLIAVTLNAPNDWNDHETMLDYGFSIYEAVTLCETGDYRAPLWIESGTQSYVMVENQDDLTVSFPVDRGEIRVTVELPRFEFAPIAAHEQVGQLVYRLCQADGSKTVVGTVPLYAAYDVEEMEYSRSLWDHIKQFFRMDDKTK
jgi:D-alanyl-D-alanine carboxypeptidase